MIYRSKHYGYVRDGQLTLDNREGFKNDLSLFDGKVVIEVYVYKKPVSGDSIRYYRGVVIPHITEALRARGETYSEDEVHTMLKIKYLAGAGDIEEGRLPHVSELTQERMTWYIEMCQLWASKVLQIVIPDPK